MNDNQKQLVIKAYAEACEDWKQQLRDAFPDLIESETDKLTVGVWYKTVSPTNGHSYIFRYSETKKRSLRGIALDINDMTFYESALFRDGEYKWRIAENKLVSEKMIKYAKKQNYKKYNFDCMINKKEEMTGWHFEHHDQSLYTAPNGCGGMVVFRDNKWAEKKKLISRVDAEKVLGMKISGI